MFEETLLENSLELKKKKFQVQDVQQIWNRIT